MKIDNNFITCTRSSDKISKLKRNCFIFNQSSLNCLNEIVFSGSCFEKKNCFFTYQSSVKMSTDRKTIVKNLRKICNKTDDNLSA